MVVSKSPFPSIHFKKLVAIRYLRYESYETLKQPTKRWGWTHKSSGPKHVEASAPPPPPVVGTPAPLQDPNFIDPAWYAWKPQGRTRVFKKKPNEIMRGVFTAWFKTWRWMDDNGFRNVFWDGLKEINFHWTSWEGLAYSLFQLSECQRVTQIEYGDKQANFFSELGSLTILEA